MINLHDDFLTNIEFGQLREQFFFGGIPWFYNENKVSGKESENINNYHTKINYIIYKFIIIVIVISYLD